MKVSHLITSLKSTATTSYSRKEEVEQFYAFVADKFGNDSVELDNFKVWCYDNYYQWEDVKLYCWRLTKRKIMGIELWMSSLDGGKVGSIPSLD